MQQSMTVCQVLVQQQTLVDNTLCGACASQADVQQPLDSPVDVKASLLGK